MYEKGVFGDNPDEAAATTINHAVLLVGYGVDKDTGEKFYKIRNSWGEKFGEEGRFIFVLTQSSYASNYI